MKLKYAIPGLILAGAFLLTNSVSYAKPEYAKKESKPCTYCHVKMGSKELNDAGKYYKEHNHSLQGYVPPK